MSEITTNHLDALATFCITATRDDFAVIFGDTNTAAHLWRKFTAYNANPVAFYATLDSYHRRKFAKGVNNLKAIQRRRELIELSKPRR